MSSQSEVCFLCQPPLVGVVSIDFSVRINFFQAAWRTRAGRPRGDFGLTSRNTGHVFGITFPSFWRHAPLSRQFSSTADHYGCSCTIFPFPFSVTVFVGGHYWRALRGVPIRGLPIPRGLHLKKKRRLNLVDLAKMQQNRRRYSRERALRSLACLPACLPRTLPPGLN